MKRLGLIAVTALFAAGCSTWDGLSRQEKARLSAPVALSEVRSSTVRSA
jgi:PBP1b-binding outer membrane lipoprotein LpoB